MQQIIEAGDLQGRSPMRKVMQGVTHGFAALAVGSADPKTAVVLGVVQPDAGRLELLCQVTHADPVKHLGGGTVGGDANHAGEGVARGRVEFHVAGFDAGESPEENGDLGQARGIHHVVGVERGETGALGVGDVGQRDRQATLVDCIFKSETFKLLFKLGLQAWINGLFELGIGLTGVGGNRG